VRTPADIAGSDVGRFDVMPLGVGGYAEHEDLPENNASLRE